MAVKVVDASALGALLFGEPEAPLIAAQLRDAEMIAPALLGFEIASICLKKLRRHPSQRAALIEALGMATRIPIAVLGVDHEAALQLADQTGLSSYDASYLWLARQHHDDLVTLDNRLAVAAR